MDFNEINLHFPGAIQQKKASFENQTSLHIHPHRIRQKYGSFYLPEIWDYRCKFLIQSAKLRQKTKMNGNLNLKRKTNGNKYLYLSVRVGFKNQTDINHFNIIIN